MNDEIKVAVLALVDSILKVDINPQYQVSDAEFQKVKAAKQRAMTLRVLLASTADVIDDEVAGTINGYRVRDVNAAIAKYNAQQSKFVVRPVANGEGKVRSAPAPRTWAAALDTFRALCDLRRPDEPDYKSIA